MEKRGIAKLGVIIVIILILAGGAGAFFILRDTKTIDGFTYEILNLNKNEICDYYFGYEGTICLKAKDSTIYYSGVETDDIILMGITKGLSEHKNMLKSSCDSPNECNRIRYVFISYPNGLDRPTFSWYYSDEKFIRIKQWGDNPGSTNSGVIKHYLEKYPPIQI